MVRDAGWSVDPENFCGEPSFFPSGFSIFMSSQHFLYSGFEIWSFTEKLLLVNVIGEIV